MVSMLVSQPAVGTLTDDVGDGVKGFDFDVPDSEIVTSA